MKSALKKRPSPKKTVVKKNPPKKTASKTTSNKRKTLKGGAQNGALYAIAILAIVALFAGVLSGGILPDIFKLRTPPAPQEPYACCDTGNGPACQPILDKQITFNGETYALLKSKIYQGEAYHLAPAELDGKHGYKESYTADGYKIFVNTSDHTASYTIPGCEQGKDLIGLQDPTKKWGGCFGVADEQLIYVCKDTPESCSNPINEGTVPFDVYFRVKDGQVPYEVANYCPKPVAGGVSGSPQRVVGLPTPSGAANLQLETFKVEQEKTQNKWLGAWCKPANYFYPEEKTQIQFDVKPRGKFVYTLPEYKQGGWNFTAFPDGTLIHQGKNYPYIYWEAAIPNELIQKPEEGYVVEYNDIKSQLSQILPEIGLNNKESGDFIEYWTNQLPEKKYYFIGIIPQSEIDSLAPVYINPKPDSILRVSLYFEPLNEKISIKAPQLKNFVREGYSMIEWGGIFDTQKHPGFSCFM